MCASGVHQLVSVTRRRTFQLCLLKYAKAEVRWGHHKCFTQLFYTSFLHIPCCVSAVSDVQDRTPYLQQLVLHAALDNIDDQRWSSKDSNCSGYFKVRC